MRILRKCTFGNRCTDHCALRSLVDCFAAYCPGRQFTKGHAGTGLDLNESQNEEPNHVHIAVSIGYDLARTHWRQGIATEAAGAIIRFGFAQMNSHRIGVSTCIDDVPSVRLVERLGFQREGIHREATLEDDGLFHGIGIFGLLRREYLL